MNNNAYVFIENVLETIRYGTIRVIIRGGQVTQVVHSISTIFTDDVNNQVLESDSGSDTVVMVEGVVEKYTLTDTNEKQLLRVKETLERRRFGELKLVIQEGIIRQIFDTHSLIYLEKVGQN